MRLFNKYLDGLDDVLSKKVEVTPSIFKNRKELFSTNIEKAVLENNSTESIANYPELIEGPKVLFQYDNTFLQDKFGYNPHAFSQNTIGPHPDFTDLPEDGYVNHHCVSVFIDIKGSTRLIEKYSLLEVRLIKDSLLTLSIQVANQFGGHVHRLQGDGIFLQFVRRDKHPNDAIINALNASAILSQFVTTDLADRMLKFGLRPLKIRIGIDFGDAEQVIWSYYGIPGCNELTTTSLHTDMAAKLQGKARDNSILIGGNIKDVLDLKSEFWNIYESDLSKEKVYYISNQFTYKFYVFNWNEYLLSLPYMGKSNDGRQLEVKDKIITISCIIQNEDGSEREQYFPNSRSIPKGKRIHYQLKRGNSDYVQAPFEKINWTAHNSGKEATNKQMAFHSFNDHFKNKTYCTTEAAFLGHHFVKCKIVRDHGTPEYFTFPIFVQ